MKKSILIGLFILTLAGRASAIVNTQTAQTTGCSTCSNIGVTNVGSPGPGNGILEMLALHYNSTTSCPAITAPPTTGTLTSGSIQGIVNGACTSSATPFACCTGSGTGSCGFSPIFINMPFVTGYQIDLKFAANTQWNGGLATVSGTTNYNGSYVVQELTARHYVLSCGGGTTCGGTATPNAVQETAGTVQMGEPWTQLGVSGTVNDGASGNYCAYLFNSPNGIGGSNNGQFTWTGAADHALAFAVEHEKDQLTGTVNDGSVTETDSGGSATSTITSHNITTNLPGDDVLTFIFGDTAIGQLTNDLVGGQNQLGGGNSGIMYPCVNIASNQPVLVGAFGCDNNTAQPFGLLEVNSPAAGSQGAETVTSNVASKYITLRVALKPQLAPQVVQTWPTGAGVVGQVPEYLTSTTTIWGDHLALVGGANATVSNSAANVFPISGVGAPVATTSEGTVMVAAPGSVSSATGMACYLTDASGALTVAGGTNYVMAMRQGGATSTVTCTIGAAANHCFGGPFSVGLTGGMLDMIDTPSGTPTALIPHCAISFN